MQSQQVNEHVTPGAAASVPIDGVPGFVRWRVIVLSAIVCLLDGFDMVVAPISVPLLTEAWGIDAVSFTPALTATVFGMALGAIFIAPLGDRIGRRPVILVSFLLVGLTSLITPLCTTVTQLTLLRLVIGVAMGASIANALALAADFSVSHQRSRVITAVYSMSAIGGLLGGFFSPMLIAHSGWQGLYVAGGVIPLVFLMVLWFGIVESPAFAGRARGNIAKRGDTTENAATDQGGPLRFLGQLLAPPYRARTLMLWALYFLSTFTTFLISSWLPTLMHLFGWSIDNSVRAMMALSFGGIVGGQAFGWLVDRQRTTLALCLGFVLAGLAMITLNLEPGSLWLWMLLIGTIGGGMIGVTFTVTALAATVYPAELRAGGIGMASATGRVGSTLAPLVGGGLLALGLSILQVLSLLLVPMLVGLVVVLAGARAFDTAANHGCGSR